jgi:RHS repeat-associated protein
LGTFVFNLRIPGQYADADSELFYNYLRDFDRFTGRYIQSDPIGLAGGVNTYEYVGANPLSVKDPRGLFAILGPFWGPIAQAAGWASGAVGAISGGVAGWEFVQQRAANESLGNLVRNQGNWCLSNGFSAVECTSFARNQQRWLECTGQIVQTGAGFPGSFSDRASPFSGLPREIR